MKTEKQKVVFELTIIFGIVGLFLFSYGALFLAAAVSGGAPSSDPGGFLHNLFHIPDLIKSDGGNLVWWHLVGANNTSLNPVIFFGTLILIVILIVVAIFGAIFLTRGGLPTFGPSFNKGIKKTSKWAGAADLRKLRVREPQRGRFVLGKFQGKLISTDEEVHVLVVGPTRSGKTTGLVIPNLLDWKGPAVVTSTKGDLVHATAGYRQTVGPVYIYDPTEQIGDPTGNGDYLTCTFSLLSRVYKINKQTKAKVPNWDLCLSVADNFTDALVKNGGGNNDWEYWKTAGNQIIAPLLYIAAVNNLGMQAVVEWVQLGGGERGMDEPKKMLEKAAREQNLPEHSVQQAMTLMQGIQNRPDKERGTVFSTTQNVFHIFSEETVMRSALTTNFFPEEMLRDNGTLYLITPAKKPDRVAPLFVSILQAVIEEAYDMAEKSNRGRLIPELGLFLDELANIVPIQDLHSIASQGAGRGVLLMSIVQDLGQLRERYGDNKMRTIFQNHAAKLILPGVSDPDTAEFIIKVVGQEELSDESKSFGKGGESSRSVSNKVQQMVTPDSLRQMEAGFELLVYKAYPPAKLNQRPWYRDKHYIKLTETLYNRLASKVRRTDGGSSAKK